MFHPQPLHLLPGLGIIDEALQKLRPSRLAASLLPNAGSALAKGGQVMFCPQPLHQLPSLGNRAHHDARKPTLLCCTNVAAWVDCGPHALQKLLLDANSALAKRG